MSAPTAALQRGIVKRRRRRVALTLVPAVRDDADDVHIFSVDSQRFSDRRPAAEYFSDRRLVHRTDQWCAGDILQTRHAPLDQSDTDRLEEAGPDRVLVELLALAGDLDARVRGDAAQQQIGRASCRERV